MKNVRAKTAWILLIFALCLFAPGSGRSQEFYVMGGGLSNSNLSDRTFSWGLEYLEGIGENFAASFSYLNEGHLPENHRDGIAAQLWIRKQLIQRQLSLAVGAGPYRYFDTRIPQGAPSSNAHGWGGVVSGTATWYTKSRWLGQIRLNWVTVNHGPNTLSVLAGIGYQLDAPPQEGPIARASAPPEIKLKHEVTGYAGVTILNSNESEKSIAGGIEYRLNFHHYLDWTIAWIHESDDRVARKDGLVSQLWLVRPFMDDRLSLSIGIGPYIQLDERHQPQDGQGGLAMFPPWYRPAQTIVSPITGRYVPPGTAWLPTTTATRISY